MITQTNLTFKLDTAATSYIFRVLPTGQLEQLYYGSLLRGTGCEPALWEKHSEGYANTVAYTQHDPNFCLDQLALEWSGVGKGDLREPAVELWSEAGACTTDFVYQNHQVSPGREPIPGLPSAWGDCETLELVLHDRITGCELTLFYHLFAECDVITRHARLTAGQPVRLRRLMSVQLDLTQGEYLQLGFCGGWAAEMQLCKTPLTPGRHVQDSKTGTSSNRHNPFCMVAETDCTEEAGRCYGLNLIYSGNHCQIAETTPHGRTRFLSGISPFCFDRPLQPGECFDSPEAVLTFSSSGFRGVSAAMHAFVKQHILRGEWAQTHRPVLVNSWEASYFNIHENNLEAQARAAKALGAELYVIDDGWFGKRNDDTTSLGDWQPNPEKLPGGLEGLANRFETIGIGLGIWVEPEMVSTESELYRRHPDWALTVPGLEPSMGRNQLVLDLSRSEVCEYLIEAIGGVIQRSQAMYVKWDMNRNLSDVCSACGSHNGDLYHRYTLGLYQVMEAITRRFPAVLFEGCSAGGNRFDLGILCYMPQIWLSDNTDGQCRTAIQTGASYGYPQSVMGAHVSACPNHQTGRTTPLASRFAVAAFGLLGYELDVTALPEAEAQTVCRQIAWYKEHRALLQFGRLYRLRFANANFTGWAVISPDQTQGVALLHQNLCQPNAVPPVLRLAGLNQAARYQITALNGEAPLCQAGGDLLCRAGLRLDRFASETARYSGQLVLPDFGSILFEIRQL